jgi:predicted dehydrogenase
MGGEGGCVADIGVHAFHLAEFLSGLRVTHVLADLGVVVKGRVLDDDCSMLLRFDNGARGALLASQIETGELNGIRVRIYGDRGALLWKHDDPNLLTVYGTKGANKLVRAGDPDLSADALAATRIGGGHPEGYLEAFANLYRDFAALLRGEEAPLLAGIDDGLRGMALIRAAVRSSAADCRWTALAIEKLVR